MMRLTIYEMRKLFDTRASVITMAVCVLAAAGLSVLAFWIQSESQVSLSASAVATVLPFALIAPVLGALAASADWKNRVIQQTLFIETRRGRLFAAKLSAAVLAALGLSLVTAAIGIALGATTALVRGQVLTAGDLGGLLWSLVALIVPGTLIGFAIGTLVLSPAVGIAIVLIAQLVLDLALLAVPEGRGTFLMSASFANWLTDGREPAAAVTSALIWIVVPGALGYLRFRWKEAS